MTKKGAFGEAKRSNEEQKIVKIPVDKSPSYDQALCIQNVSKINGRRVVELELLTEALDRGCNILSQFLTKHVRKMTLFQ